MVRRGIKQGDRQESSLFESQLNQQETPRPVELPHGGAKVSTTPDDTNKLNAGNYPFIFSRIQIWANLSRCFILSLT
jgi:hypothetical protein